MAEVHTSAVFPPEFENRALVPHLFWPRSYQRKGFEAYEAGIRRFMWVWPRRGGKDHCALNFTIPRMEERVGTYFHVFPELAMGKRIIWTETTSGGKTPDGKLVQGFSFLEHFPPQLCQNDGRMGRNESELTVDFANGSKYQIMGADNPDRLRGPNPKGVNFSECALMSVKPWRIVEPILIANEGWATFNTTPQGLDWFTRLWFATQDDPAWFHSLHTNDTIRRDGILFGRNPISGLYEPFPEDGGQLYAPEEIEAMRARGVEEEWIQQELFCSFAGAKAGTYYGKLISEARAAGRIGMYPYDPRYPVSTAWDIGIADLMVVWWWQNIDESIRLIDYHEEAGRSIEYFIGMVRQRPYQYAQHWAPHDIKARDAFSGKSRLIAARDIGFHFRLVDAISPADGRNAVRNLLPRCYFDENKTDGGIQALENYKSEYSDKMEMQKPNPIHNRWSHGADAFRYLAIVADRDNDTRRRGAVVSETEFDPLAS